MIKLPHKLPINIHHTLKSKPKIEDIWNTLTPLAQNEWICWLISPKKEETKDRHLKRFQEDLLHGKRRPCCFAGCPHRQK